MTVLSAYLEPIREPRSEGVRPQMAPKTARFGVRPRRFSDRHLELRATRSAARGEQGGPRAGATPIGVVLFQPVAIRYASAVMAVGREDACGVL